MERLQTRTRRKKQPSRLLLFSLIVLTGLVGFNTLRVYFISRSVKKDGEGLSAQIQSRQKDIETLKEKLNMLESGEGVELEARGRLNLQKSDEHVLIIVEKETATSSEDEESSGFWHRLKSWLPFQD